MANADRPRGFWPHGTVKQQLVAEAGSECFPGDFVKLASDGQVDPISTGNDIYGLCLSYASAAGADVLLSVDPEQIYTSQADEADIDAQTDIGQLCDVTATAGNSTYKTSRQEIDSSTITSGGSAQLLIVGIEERADNAFGAQVDVRVKINEHQFIGENDSVGI